MMNTFDFCSVQASEDIMVKASAGPEKEITCVAAIRETFVLALS